MKRFLITIISLIVVLLAAIALGTGSGSVNVSLLQVLMHPDFSNPYTQIIMNIRLPRVLAAVVLGGALSVSGFILQVFFNNPIAGPYILGISSGAKLVVAISMIVFMGHGIYLGSFGMVFMAFLGSLLAMGLVLLVSLKVRRMSMLIVCGILIGYICSAVTDLFVTFADDANIVNLHNWSLGSFSGIGWNHFVVMVAVVLACVLIVLILSKPLNAYQLGENYARNLGVNILALRVALILLSSLLAGCVTAFAGPISFVGIAVPHLCKLMLKSTRPAYMVPCVFLMGAVVTLVCDMLARVVFAPTELSVSTVTAVLLAPVVIVMMVRKQGRE